MASLVIRLRRVEVVVADLGSAERFYGESFGFTQLSKQVDEGAAYAKLLGLEDVHSKTTVLQLGPDELALTSYDSRGRDYPRESTAADLWFQHIAIVVRDANAAYDRLRQSGRMISISTDGPQRLPPNTGCVTAFKFRDPEGHPIEISEFPPGVGAARWHAGNTGPNCLGIDHSAISVANVSRSIAFYCDVLGMKAAFQSVNRGTEQDRLDGLSSDGVDIVALHAADEESPHIELLGYHPAGRSSAMSRANDIAATKLSLQVEDLSRAVASLRAAGVSFVSPGVVTLDSGEHAALVHDPDTCFCSRSEPRVSVSGSLAHRRLRSHR
jgi:catechol 2,3-dioxygenase-like lactoylglutathione lyase family enzyme